MIITADDMRKLGAKTARDRLKESLKEALPKIAWHVNERHKLEEFPEVRVVALVHATALNAKLSDPQEPHRVLSILEETFPGLPWSIRTQYVEELRPGKEPKTSGSLHITLSEFAVSSSEAPPGIQKKMRETIKRRREFDESMAKWRRHEALDADPDLQREALELGLKELAKRHHPDVGGNHDAMVRINKLREKLKP